MGIFDRRSAPAAQSPDNPARGLEYTLELQRGERKWTESGNLVEILAEVLRTQGHEAAARGQWVEHGSGLLLVPGLADLELRTDGDVRTLSTLQVSHSELVPEGVFEFQHAIGADVNASLAAGFSGWAEIDLPVFLDALRDSATQCAEMLLTPDTESSRLTHARRIVLGPVSHTVKEPAPGAEAHPFCPCCLLTNTLDAFDGLMNEAGFAAIRLYAARIDGVAQADCRVNGVDFPAGTAALVRYVNEWPQRGFETRKQYVAVLSPR